MAVVSEIPEDIREKAKEAYFADSGDPVYDIAHAILAERNRCAEIVADYMTASINDPIVDSIHARILDPNWVE